MPNHIHLIWRLNEANGKESAKGSFLKFTAHEFKKELIKSDPAALEKYRVAAANKQYEFWQRDSLGVHLYSREVTLQKLDYIHNNPLAAHWNLANDPCDYKYSSASYYERNECNFAFLKDLMMEI
jgi:putative transposase